MSEETPPPPPIPAAPDASAPPVWYALLVALLTLIETLEARIADLQTRNADLEACLTAAWSRG